MKIALFIGVITVLHLLGYWLLVYWTSHVRVAGDVKAGEIINHTWDGDLQERNNPLPNWWLKMFYGMIIVGAAYLIVFPGVLGYEYGGTAKWTQLEQYQAEKKAHDERSNGYFSAFANVPIAELAKNPEAVASGRRLFLQNCALCHGSNGQGAAVGYPNLADNDWLWGGDEKNLLNTIKNGRNNKKGQGMPAGGALVNPAKPKDGDDEKLTAVAHYVRSLSSQDGFDRALADKGKPLFERTCAGCHGKNGEGKMAVGGPNLADGTWLYSLDGSVDDIKRQILAPANNVMPAWQGRISENRLRAIGAYVYSLSHEE